MTDEQLFGQWWKPYWKGIKSVMSYKILAQTAFDAALQIGREEEREACAEIADDHIIKGLDRCVGLRVAEAIRSRERRKEMQNDLRSTDYKEMFELEQEKVQSLLRQLKEQRGRLRDEFAMNALNGLCGLIWATREIPEPSTKDHAVMAYRYADNMLKAREATND